MASCIEGYRRHCERDIAKTGRISNLSQDLSKILPSWNRFCRPPTAYSRSISFHLPKSTFTKETSHTILSLLSLLSMNLAAFRFIPRIVLSTWAVFFVYFQICDAFIEKMSNALSVLGMPHESRRCPRWQNRCQLLSSDCGRRSKEDSCRN